MSGFQAHRATLVEELHLTLVTGFIHTLIEVLKRSIKMSPELVSHSCRRSSGSHQKVVEAAVKSCQIRRLATLGIKTRIIKAAPCSRFLDMFIKGDGAAETVWAGRDFSFISWGWTYDNLNIITAAPCCSGESKRRHIVVGLCFKKKTHNVILKM